MIPATIALSAYYLCDPAALDLKSSVSTMKSYLIFFVVFLALYSLMTWWAFAHRDRADLERIVRSTSRHPSTLIQRLASWLTSSGTNAWAAQITTLSLGAALLICLIPQLRSDGSLLALSAAVVISGWWTMVSVYAIGYMRIDIPDRHLEFPGEKEPTFYDYLYLSVQMQTTFAGSDISFRDTTSRRLATAHSLYAFSFSTVIVAMIVSALLSTS